MRAAANDAGARREVKARGRFRYRTTAARKFFGRQIACRPFRTSDAGDRYHTKKYDSATITTTATTNQIMGWVMFCWVWVSVVMEFAPSSWAGGRRAGTFPVLGDPSCAFDFRLIARLSLDSDQKPAADATSA